MREALIRHPRHGSLPICATLLAAAMALLALLAFPAASSASTPWETDAAATATQVSQPATAPLRVGVFVSPPFVTKDAKGEYSGYAWELWSESERRMEVKSVVQEFPSFGELLDAVIAGKVDAAVTDMFITSERERRMEFTHPIADGGLRVMVNTKRESKLFTLWNGLVNDGHARIIGWGALIVIALAVPLAFFWRHLDKDFPQKPLDAFAESLYRIVAVTMSGKTKVTSISTWHTKVIAAAWLVVGVSVVAYITSTVTSVMTKQALRGTINSVADLEGKTAGVVIKSLADQYCRDSGIAADTFQTLDEAVEALVAGKVAAVVGDGLALEAYDHSHPKLPIDEVGPLFEKRRYGIGVPSGSPLRHQLNVVLTELAESGASDKLYVKYFGN
jgi:ABC-type amino acid transport substrate-binding protein